MLERKNKTELQTSRQEQKRVDQVATKVKVGDLDRSDLRFFHRDKKYLGEEQLKQLLASIHHEGLQVPIEFYRDGDRKVLVKGHLRVAAYHLLARKGTPGFSLENEIDAIEVRTSDTKDLLVRSISDNTVRRSLDQVDRIPRRSGALRGERARIPSRGGAGRLSSIVPARSTHCRRPLDVRSRRPGQHQPHCCGQDPQSD